MQPSSGTKIREFWVVLEMLIKADLGWKKTFDGGRKRLIGRACGIRSRPHLNAIHHRALTCQILAANPFIQIILLKLLVKKKFIWIIGVVCMESSDQNFDILQDAPYLCQTKLVSENLIRNECQTGACCFRQIFNFS